MFLLSSDYKMVHSREFFVGGPWSRYLVETTVDARQKSNQLVARLDLSDKGDLWVDDAELIRIGKDEDLAAYDPSGYGYRHRSGTGNVQITVEVGGASGLDLPNIQGVCRFDPLLKELNLKTVRIHNVLTSLGVLGKDSAGRLTYTWDALDRAVADVLSIGAVPQMSLCFVPLDLVDNPDPKKIRKDYKPPIYHGPPSDLAKWEAYIAAVVGHCKEKYDISGWFWIFGNEPGVAQFSMGTEEQYYDLYKHTVTAAQKVCPTIRIGAGSFAHMDWLQRFIGRCGRDRTPVSLLSWHHYGLLPEDYLANIARVRSWTAPYENLRGAALAIDEWNPKLPDDGTPLSANEYAAAQQAATIATMIDGGLLYHAFFIAHDGGRRNGLIDLKRGVRNPTFNVFKMFAMMGRQRLAVRVPEEEPYVGALASRDEGGRASVLVWNAKYQYDLHPGLTKEVTVSLGEAYKGAGVEVYLIDATRSNGYNDPQRQQLEKTTDSNAEGGRVRLTLKPNSVALVLAAPK